MNKAEFQAGIKAISDAVDMATAAETERCMTLAIHRAQEYFKKREDDYGYAVSQFADEIRRTAIERIEVSKVIDEIRAAYQKGKHDGAAAENKRCAKLLEARRDTPFLESWIRLELSEAVDEVRRMAPNAGKPPS